MTKLININLHKDLYVIINNEFLNRECPRCGAVSVLNKI